MGWAAALGLEPTLSLTSTEKCGDDPCASGLRRSGAETLKPAGRHRNYATPRDVAVVLIRLDPGDYPLSSSRGCGSDERTTRFCTDGVGGWLRIWSSVTRRTVSGKVVEMRGLMMVPFAVTLSGGSLIFVGFAVTWFFVLSYSYYTRRGSGINQRPYADLDHNSGRETPSELAHDITQDVRNWDRGVAGRHRRRHPPRPRS